MTSRRKPEPRGGGGTESSNRVPAPASGDLIAEAENLGKVSKRDRAVGGLVDTTGAVPGLGSVVALLAHQVVTPDWQKNVQRFATDIARTVEDIRDRLPQTSPAAAETAGPASPIALASVLEDWRDRTVGPGAIPVYVVVGGSLKYDPERARLGLKEYQSTEPVTGVVRVARALSRAMAARFVDAVCDYSPILRTAERELDLVIVGGGDTNRVSKELFRLGLDDLPARFEPPSSSDAIVVESVEMALSTPGTGLVLALTSPKPFVRFAVVCAGNGASGTNAALDTLAGWLVGPKARWPKVPAVVVQLIGDDQIRQVWPPRIA
jgi:hypothetical protein